MDRLSHRLEEAVKSLILTHDACTDADFGSKKKLLTKFVYDEAADTCVLVSLGDDGVSLINLSDTDDSRITPGKLAELKNIHDKIFEDNLIAASWERLFSVFVAPVLEVVAEDFKGYIFTIFDDPVFADDSGSPIFFNLAHLFNLCFLFAKTGARHNQITFVNVSDDPVKFIRRLSIAQRPLAGDMDIIYGFPKQYDPVALEADIGNEMLQRGKAREDAFMQGLAAAGAGGASVFVLQDIGVFEKVFEKTHQGRVVQLLTHFHDGKIFTPGLKAFVHINSVANLLDRMFDEDRLRNDIALHAATCNNFSYFKILFSKGIENIYYSSNDLNLNSIAGRFAELYTGYNAKLIGFEYPYLDGDSFIFEAWEKVFRCFCKLNFS